MSGSNQETSNEHENTATEQGDQQDSFQLLDHGLGLGPAPGSDQGDGKNVVTLL